jgi:hypothetical protein
LPGASRSGTRWFGTVAGVVLGVRVSAGGAAGDGSRRGVDTGGVGPTVLWCGGAPGRAWKRGGWPGCPARPPQVHAPPPKGPAAVHFAHPAGRVGRAGATPDEGSAHMPGTPETQPMAPSL